MKSAKQLFQMTERLITDQTETTGLTTIEWKQPMWKETTLLTDRAVQFAIAKTYVFSGSLLCLGGISNEPVEAWENWIKWYLETDLCKELSKNFEVAGKLTANEDLESMEIPTELPIDDPHTQAQLQGNLLQDYERKFEQIL